MIIFDFSQIIIGSTLDYWRQTKEEISIDLLRHIALNNILNIKNKVGSTDKVTICLDGRNYWRKQVFPFYKQNRKKTREKDAFNWDTFHKVFNQLKAEFQENLPYKIIEVDSAEADDLISVLTRRVFTDQNVIIISSDKDFIQLHNHKTKQFSPYHKKYLKNDDYDIFEHVVCGDASDGIPNILSDDDVFVEDSKRSKPIRKKQLEEWKQYGLLNPDRFCNSVLMLDKFYRNRLLIDLTKIPEELEESVIKAYNETPVQSKNLFDYLTKNKLRKILERCDF